MVIAINIVTIELQGEKRFEQQNARKSILGKSKKSRDSEKNENPKQAQLLFPAKF